MNLNYYPLIHNKNTILLFQTLTGITASHCDFEGHTNKSIVVTLLWLIVFYPCRWTPKCLSPMLRLSRYLNRSEQHVECPDRSLPECNSCREKAQQKAKKYYMINIDIICRWWVLISTYIDAESPGRRPCTSYKPRPRPVGVGRSVGYLPSPGL